MIQTKSSSDKTDNTDKTVNTVNRDNTDNTDNVDKQDNFYNSDLNFAFCTKSTSLPEQICEFCAVMPSFNSSTSILAWVWEFKKNTKSERGADFTVQ